MSKVSSHFLNSGNWRRQTRKGSASLFLPLTKRSNTISLRELRVGKSVHAGKTDWWSCLQKTAKIGTGELKRGTTCVGIQGPCGSCWQKSWSKRVTSSHQTGPAPSRSLFVVTVTCAQVLILHFRRYLLYKGAKDEEGTDSEPHMLRLLACEEWNPTPGGFLPAQQGTSKWRYTCL